MPIYEYRCSEHGRFSKRKTLDRAGKDGICPQCGAFSKRVMSIFVSRIAVPFAVLDHKGNVLQMTQTTEKPPPPMYGMDKNI